jgi:Domain of unknown function (DUF222)
MGLGVVAKRVAAMSAELDELLAEPLEMLSTAERLALTHQWETLTRRQAAMGHRLVASLAEAPVAEIACGVNPDELRAAAGRLAALLDEDGELSDRDRARRRYLSIGKQQPDGTSELRGRLDPEGRAVLDAVLAKLTAPGMCNPDDESPCIDGDPSIEAKQGDSRSQGHRNHDALTAMGRALLASATLGSHNGHPGHLYDSAGAGIGCRACGDRWGQSASDVGGDPPSRCRAPLSGGVRQTHRGAAVFGAGAAAGVQGATNHALQQGTRLHSTRLHRPGQPF